MSFFKITESFSHVEDLLFWRAQPRDQADHRHTSHVEQVQWICRCRVEFYQDLVILGRKFCYVGELKNIRWSVLRVYNLFHNVLFKISAGF